MKDESTVSDDLRTASRRGLLTGGLGVGIAAAAGAIVSAVTSAEKDAHRGPTGGSGSASVAHGGMIHTDRHGGVTHTHDKVSHTHAVMVHALDARTVKYVDTADRPGPRP